MRRLARHSAKLTMFAVMAVGLVLTACDGDGGDDTAAATATESATAVSAPSPTSTPAPQTSPEQRYLDAVAERLRGLTASARSVASILAEPDVDSAEWRAEARAALDELRAHHAAAASLTVPRDLEAVQAALLAATAPFDRAAELIVEGMEMLEPGPFAGAAAEINTGIAAIEEARITLRDARATLDLP